MSERIEWTPDLDSQLREHVAQGKTIRSLAEAWGVNHGHVSRRAKRLGLLLQTKANNGVTETNRERLAEARERLAEAAIADALAIRERLWDEYEVVIMTPNGPEHSTLDLPDAKATAEFTASIERLIKTHEQLERIGSARSSEVAKSAIMKLQDDLQAAIEQLDTEDAE